jgi:hypothetical protein
METLVPVGSESSFSNLPVNSTDEYVFIPTADCDAIRITLKTDNGGILGFVATNTTDIYYAYILDQTCNPGSFTTIRSSSVLDLGSKITNPYQAIDGDVVSFSNFGFGLGVATTLYQNIYFSKPASAQDAVSLTVSMPPALVAAGVLSYINVKAYNDDALVGTTSFSGLLLGTDLLALLNSGGRTTISIIPGAKFNRIELSMSALVSLATSLNLHEVQITPQKPTFTSPSNASIVNICTGNTAVLGATTEPGNELIWYSSLTEVNPLTSNSDGTFTTPALTASTNYYVSSRKTGCNAESERVQVQVIVHPPPVVNPITGPTTFCRGIGQFIYTTSTGGLWKSSNEAIARVTPEGLVTGIAVGSATIRYELTDPITKCMVTAYYNITISNPTASISGSVNVCINAIEPAITFTGANGVLPYTFTYTLNGVTNTATTPIGNSSVSIPQPTSSAGTFIYVLTGIKDNSSTPCAPTVAPATATINVVNYPVVTPISGNTSICIGKTTTLSSTPGSGSWSSSAVGVATVNNGVVNAISPGTTTITYKVTNSPACTTTVNTTVTVYALPTITLGTMPKICQEQLLTSIPYTSTSGGTLEYSIMWNDLPNIGYQPLPISPIPLTIPGDAPHGIHNGSFTIRNANGCVNSYPISITVNIKPAIPYIDIHSN